MNQRLRLAITLLALLFACQPACAQDFDRLAPKQLPVPPDRARPPAAGPIAPVVPEGSAPLVHSLHAIVFLPGADRVIKPADMENRRGLLFEGVVVPDEKKFRRQFGKYLGLPLTLDSINAMAREILVYYRAHDRPVVDVIVPEQDITPGVLQLVILESRVGGVKASGNRWFSSSLIESEMHLEDGDPIRASRVAAGLTRLNANPFREVSVLYTPGTRYGTTAIQLETRDRLPLRLYTGYENSGVVSTGANRWLAGFNWGNVFGADHQLSYQFTTSDDFQSSLGHALTYTAPLPWGHSIDLIGLVSQSRASSADSFQNSGMSSQASLRYKIPLPQAGPVTQGMFAGFDFKRTNNNLDFGGSSVFNTNIDIFQWLAGYEASARDRAGSTNGNITLFYSPGGLDANNTDAAFQQARAGSGSDYFYTRMALERVNRLPMDFSLAARGVLQWASTNLQASEQLGLGGADTVRGYEEGVARGDSGMQFTLELRTPPIALVPLLRQARTSHAAAGKDGRTPPSLQEKEIITDRLQFLCFWDYGIAALRHPSPDESRQVNLSSLGVGLRYTVNTWISIRFDYGWQMLAIDNTHSRAHLGVIMSY